MTEKLKVRTRVEKKSRNLKCLLTKEEKLALGQDLAQAVAKAVEMDNARKEIAADYAHRLKEAQGKAERLGRTIGQGYEYRDVECSWEFDYERRQVTVSRNDTGEIIEERAMTADEAQMSFPAA